MNNTRTRGLGIAMAGAVTAALLISGVADAHVVKTIGTYSVALGWVHEPTFVGELNAVQVVIKDAAGKPVNDLNDGDLKVTVSVGGQTSNPLSLLNTFDPDTGLGVPGDYEAAIIPTAPGDYTFHLTGSIHGTAVDETATSSDSTFNSAVDSTGIQFPNQLPTLTEITTRLDRIDARLSPAPGASGTTTAPIPSSPAGGSTGLDAANAAAAAAQSSANTALLVGGVLGALGVIMGGAALVVALRGRRPVA